MAADVPTIFAPIPTPLRLDTRGRLLAAGIALACLTVFAVAADLAPDPAGVGTVARLGMMPCGFLQRTGLPCAACGMTTSFDHFVRFEWLQSLWAQPMGFVLAALTGVTFWAAAYIAATGRPAHRLLRRLPGARLLVLLVALGIMAWGWKIALTLTGHAGTAW